MLWIRNRVDAKSGYFFFLPSDVTRSSPVLNREYSRWYWEQCYRFFTSGTSASSLNNVCAVKPTIMDKSLGTVVQFERFLTHAKLYPRATSTVRPYPLRPPQRQCWNRQGTIPLIIQHCIGWGGGRGHGFVKREHCFLRQNLWNA